MTDITTTLGGGGDAFPETAWSRLTLGSAGTEDLELLARLYWRPVYRFIRAAAACSAEDAKDIAQDFFEDLLDGRLLSRYQPERGRFRSYLKTALRRHLSHERRDRARLKRGGGRARLPLDALDGLPDLRADSPEEAFDRQWAGDVMSRALESLRAALEAEGRTEALRAFEAYYGFADGFSGADGYEALAARLGIPPQRIKSALDQVRDRLDAELRRILSQGVASYEDLAGELKDLLLP